MPTAKFYFRDDDGGLLDGGSIEIPTGQLFSSSGRGRIEHDSMNAVIDLFGRNGRVPLTEPFRFTWGEQEFNNCRLVSAGPHLAFEYYDSPSEE